jgi:hypothetical protein
MALTNAFKEAVSSSNVRLIRIMMKDSMLVDPTFSVFNAMNNAARDLSGLYDTHDGQELNYDRSTWNDSYMNELMVQIVGNFSQERVDHLKNIVRQLYPVAIRTQEEQSSVRSFLERGATREQTYSHRADHPNKEYHDRQNCSYRGTKIAGGAITGAVVGGAIAVARVMYFPNVFYMGSVHAAGGAMAATSVAVIGGVAIGAVAGAVIAIVLTNRE